MRPNSTSVVTSPSETTATRRKGVNGRAKGKRLEKEVAEKLSAWLGLPASEFVRARAGTKEPDVALSQSAAAAFPYHVECKHRAVMALPKWIDQAVQDAKLVSEGREPIVVYKEARRLLVCTRVLHFVELLSKRDMDYAHLWDHALVTAREKMGDLWLSCSFNFFMELATSRVNS